jgi:hypothetical protein
VLALQANPKLAVKLAFLVAALAQGRMAVATTAAHAGVIEQLVHALPAGPPFAESHDSSAVWEHGSVQSHLHHLPTTSRRRPFLFHDIYRLAVSCCFWLFLAVSEGL